MVGVGTAGLSHDLCSGGQGARKISDFEPSKFEAF